MKKKALRKAIILAGFYKSGWITGHETEFAIGGELVDGVVFYECIETGTNKGEDGVCHYDQNRQICLDGILEDEHLIVAEYEDEYHVYATIYDETVDIYIPIFLGSFKI